MNARMIFAAALLALVGASAAAQTKDDGTVRHSGDTLVINTTAIGADVIGFNDVTPLEVKVLGGKVVDIVALPNGDTPSFFGRAFAALKPNWLGKSVKEAKAVTPDAVSGATYSSKAIIRNVSLALDAAAGR